jgi:excisionase family DNA binding protein
VEEWLSIKQACEYLGISESTMRRRIKDKKVIAEKVSNENGQQWFVLSQSLLGYKAAEQGQTLPTLQELESIQKGLLLATHKAIQEELAANKEELLAAFSVEFSQLSEQLGQLLKENEQLKEEVQSLREKKRPFWQRLFNHS